MSKQRNPYIPEFKAKVALAALKNEESISEISARFEVHLTMINNWSRALLEGAADVFDKGHKARKQNEAHVEDLYRQVGKSKLEKDSTTSGNGKKMRFLWQDRFVGMPGKGLIRMVRLEFLYHTPARPLPRR